jgi:hypothetical protein
MAQFTLTKKQLSVIDEIFIGESQYIDIEAILQKHRVSTAQYNRWLADENFRENFTRRIEWLNLQSQALIAKYASLAAAKLITLTDSEKEEVRRKACLDIISLPRTNAQKQGNVTQNDDNYADQKLNPETASRLLEALAQEKISGH